MRSLRGQFILSHILPFVIILPLAGLVLLFMLEAQIVLGQLSDNLEERAALIAEAVARQPELLADEAAARRFIAEISPLTDGEVYLLDAEGKLIAAAPTLVDGPDSELVAAAARTPRLARVSTSYGVTEQTGEALAPVIDINEQLVGIVGVRESISSLAAAFGPMRRLVSYIVLGGMAVGVLAGYWLANRLARPISETAAAVGTIATGIDASPLSPKGPREVQQLTESVNTLAARLRSLEEMRRRSFANIVHELGRPLGAVLAAIAVLRGSAGADPAIREELLAGIHKELTALEPLLEDMSQLHAEATGNIRLDRRPVALSDWLHESITPWREAAAARGLSWVVEIPPDLPAANIDPQRLGQVIGNLLSNALKYTESGGIAVYATHSQNEVAISVADTGPGIPSDEQMRIFDPFYRGTTPQRTTEGLGVGLAIARGLAEAHGGRLTVESAPGRGSVFTIHLPVATDE
jgi:signal transduction histidine kinase